MTIYLIIKEDKIVTTTMFLSRAIEIAEAIEKKTGIAVTIAKTERYDHREEESRKDDETYEERQINKVLGFCTDHNYHFKITGLNRETHLLNINRSQLKKIKGIFKE